MRRAKVDEEEKPGNAAGKCTTNMAADRTMRKRETRRCNVRTMTGTGSRL